MATDLNNDIKAFARVASGTNSFFPEARANMNPADFRRLRANYVDNVAPLEDRLANMRNNVARLQSQELAFRQSMLAFDQQKEDLARRKEAQDPEKIEAIGNIVAGELPAADKKDAIFKMGIWPVFTYAELQKQEQQKPSFVISCSITVRQGSIQSNSLIWGRSTLRQPSLD